MRARFTTTQPVGSSGRTVSVEWELWTVENEDEPNPLRRWGVRWRHAGDLGDYRQVFTPCRADLPTLIVEIIEDPYYRN